MLSGKKTYLAGIAAVLGAVAAALAGTMSWAEALAIIVPAVLGMTVRAGVSTETAKTAAKVAAPLVLAVLALGGCATTTQPTDLANRANTGEGDKDTTAAAFGAVATTRETARLSDRDLAGGGGDVTEPVIVWNAETKSYQTVLGPDGAPVMRHVKGLRDYYNMVANTITTSATGSGTTTGTTSQGGTQAPTSTTTTDVKPETNVSGLPK